MPRIGRIYHQLLRLHVILPETSPFIYVAVVIFIALNFTLCVGVAQETNCAQPDLATFPGVPRITPVHREYLPGRSLAIYQPGDFRTGTNPAPALLFVHGGGWAQGMPALYAPHARYFAARGGVAITVQYRLTAQAGITVFDCIADVKAAVRWVRSHARELGIDPAKIGMVGDSAGGHLAACAGIIEGLEAPGQDGSISSRPDAIIALYPIVDTTPPDGWDLVRFSGKPGQAVAGRARDFSPIDHIASGIPPLLVIHGTADTVVSPADAERFTAALRRAGNHAELEMIPGGRHAFFTLGYGDDATILRTLARIETFLATLGWIKTPALSQPCR